MHNRSTILTLEDIYYSELLKRNWIPTQVDTVCEGYTGWKENKCHRRRRGRFKGQKKLYTVWGLNLIVSSEKGVSCSVLFTLHCLYR